MPTWKNRFKPLLVLLRILIGSAAAFATTTPGVPTAVSPGGTDRILKIKERCPTFNWSGVEDARGYELAVYRLSESDDTGDGAAEPVFRQALPRGAHGWTPSLERCLHPGSAYAWAVRALGEEAAGDWSEPRLLQVATEAPGTELEWALAVVARYLDAGGHLEDLAPSRGEGLDQTLADAGSRSVTGVGPEPKAPGASSLGSGASAAISGTSTDLTGEAYGVVGVSHSPEGAGVRAENVDPAGPDLLLAGDSPAVVTENGLLREAATDVTFDFSNRGSGTMTLSVDGAQVVTTLTDQNTEYSAGNQLALTGTAFDVVEGAGSGLDADLLDGLDSGVFAAAATLASHLTDTGNPHQVTASQVTPLTTKGDLEVHDGSTVVRLPVGATGHFLRANASAPSGLDWGEAFSPSGQACPPLHHLAGFRPDGTLLCRPVRPLPLPVQSTTTLDSTGSVGDHSSIAIGADGLPVIVYTDFTNIAHKVAHCSDLACTSATLSTLDDTGSVISYASIAIGFDGLPLVAYSAVGDLRVAHCDDVACTSASSSTIDPAGVGAYLSLAVGQDGLPVISYWKASGFDLFVARCLDSVCTAATTVAVDSSGDVGPWNSLAIGADGRPVISYFDYGNENLKVAHCDDPGCSSATLVTVDDNGFTGRYTSMAVGADGLPVISYQAQISGPLRVAHCLDLACSAATLSTVNSVFGADTSLTIGADGLPVIVYRGNAGDYSDLAVAHCNDPACTSATRTFVETDGLLLAPSVALGADGLPVISYSDYTNRDLKAAHCGNAACS